MKSLLSIIEISAIFNSFDYIICYQPLNGEVDYTQMPFLVDKVGKIFSLPNDKNSDPFVWAEKCQQNYKNKSVGILIPGTKFDIKGTRHGRGFGWYDRFLSRIPKNWIRIGITVSTQFSISTIKKEDWDEPVDFVIVQTTSDWLFYKTNDVRQLS